MHLVPILYFITTCGQFIVIEHLEQENLEYNKILMANDIWKLIAPLLFIFCSLAADHHYFWNVFVLSPLFLSTTIKAS